ncbi:MAG: LysM peptidoglycan-binding domain-containing protein [Lachnospiraceae bacterium]|nr:LysM peptidoglycan-binding domain-containing protein [Lachnospiraceae bacterium]
MKKVKSRRIRSRLLSVLISLSMIFGLIPGMDMTVMAQNYATDAQAVLDGMVCRIGDEGGSYYPSLQDAVNSADFGDTVTLLADVTVSSRVEVRRNITIDLDGHTVKAQTSCINGSAFHIVENATVIKNGIIDGTEVEETEDGNVKIEDGICLITVRKKATLSLTQDLNEELHMIVNSKNGCCIYVFDGGTVNISGGTYENRTTDAYQYRKGFQGLIVNQANVNTKLIHITGGTFIGNDPQLGDDNGDKNPDASTFVEAGYVAIPSTTTGVFTVKEGYTVNFNLGGGTYTPVGGTVTTEPVEIRVEKGQTVAALDPVPNKDDCNFSGWSDGTDIVTFPYTPSADITLTAKFKVGLWGEIKAQADLTGRAWANDDSFEFTISAADGTPMPSKTSVTVTKDSTDKTESFGKIMFTEAGEYSYILSQTHAGETIGGVAYDSADKTVTIKVKDDGKGHLVADGTALVQTAEFTNAYGATGSATISTSVAANAALGNIEFTFQLLNKNGEVLQTGSKTKQGETGSFHTLDYDLGDAGQTITYKIQQVIPVGAKGKGNNKYEKDDVIYDGEVKEVTVTVSNDKGDGTLDVSVSGSPATFTNGLVTSSLEIHNSVTSSTANDKNREFRFTVALTDSSINGTYGGLTFMNGEANIRLKDGETITAENLPVGMGYTVTETEVSGFTVTKSNNIGTIASTSVKAEFKFTRDEGNLKVQLDEGSSEVTVTLSNDYINGTYGEMTFMNGTATFNLVSGQAITASGLPAGMGYQVTATGDFDTATGTIAKGETTIVKLTKKAAAVVTTAPMVKTLTYDATTQTLATAGAASGGSLVYAIGDKNGATESYTDQIPAKKNAGTYYLWYKAVGDADHVDSAENHIEVTIQKRKLSVSISDRTFTYNGETLYGYTPTTLGVMSVTNLANNETFIISYVPSSGTNVGTYENGSFDATTYNVLDGAENVSDNYELETLTAGKLKITPKKVTITAKSQQFTYDGTAHSNAGYDVTGLVDEDAITAIVNGSITYPSEGSVVNKIDSYQFTSGSASNYNVTTVNGALTMVNTSNAITITAASEEWTYDGTVHANNAVTVTSGTLLTGDTLVATATGSVTNVVDTAVGNNPVAAGYKVMHGTEDVTANYVITTQAGTLTVTPAHVEITAKSQQFTYDGIAHSNAGYDIDGLVGADVVTAVVTGSIMFPSEGPVENKIDSYQFTSGSASNYNVTTVNGSLTMVNASNAITITAASDEWTYDGTAHTNNAVTVTSGTLLTGDTLVATATGSVTNVVDTMVGNNLVAAGYKVMHGTEDVTASYVITPQAGTLTVTTALVEITAQSKNFTYNGIAQSHAAFDVTGLVGEDAITAVVTGSIMFPSEGTVVNQLTSYQFTKGDARNYSVTTTNGTLTMSNASQAITITAASDAWTYDASAHTNNEVTLTSGTLFTGDTLVAAATGSVTNVVDTAVGNNPVAADYKVMHGTEDVTASYVITAQAGMLTVNPKPISVVAHPAMKEFEAKDPEFKYTVVGLLGSDGMSGALSREPGEKAGKYEIVLGTLTAGSNYAINYTSSTLTILEEDYLNELRRLLTYAIALGGNQTVTWEKGTALPYDIMKTLQDHPQLTLIFKYYYGNMSYEVTIHGKDVVTDPKITWYGPMNLYGRYGLKIGFINPSGVTGSYVVVRGDNLTKIARRLNTSVDWLVKVNMIKNPSLIWAKQVLKY